MTYTDGPGDYLTVVDATTGTLLWRKNMRNYRRRRSRRASASTCRPTASRPPTARRRCRRPRSPPGRARSTPRSPARSSRCCRRRTSRPARTAGFPMAARRRRATTSTRASIASAAPATNVCDAGSLDDNGRPVGNPDASGNNRDFLGSAVRNFDYTPAPLGGNPDAGDTPTGHRARAQDAFRRGAVTQLFYVTNWYHDRLFHLGFDEAAGNFQTVEFQRHGRSAAMPCGRTRRTDRGPTTPTSRRRRTACPGACRCIASPARRSIATAASMPRSSSTS